MELKWKHFIDASKGLTPVVCIGMMHKFDQWENSTAWTYFGLHGSYGLLWVLKSQIFPDAAWERPNTLKGEALEAAKKGGFNTMDLLGRIMGPFTGLSIFGALAGYWANIWYICKNGFEAPKWLLGVSTFVYSVGVFLHFTSDMQKHVTLQHKRGLITDMMFGNTRNPNYLGEALIYGSFAALTCQPLAWAYFMFNFFVLWYPNMVKKDKSISRHNGWEEYSQRSWMFFPRLF